ncbi:hypothetical protein AAG978_002662 [Listeria innocua]
MTDNLFPNLAHENCKEPMPPVTTEQFKEAAILEKNRKLEEILNIVDKKKPSIKKITRTCSRRFFLYTLIPS